MRGPSDAKTTRSHREGGLKPTRVFGMEVDVGDLGNNIIIIIIIIIIFHCK